MKKDIFILLLLMFFGLNLSAQDEKCGMDAHMHEMMQDPDFAKQWQIDQAKFRRAVAESIYNRQRRVAMDPIVVPVAVHFPGGVESDRACLEALAQNQVDIVNLDFTATNGDANLWATASAFYPGVIHGAANIQFCIATQDHPADTDDDLVEGGPAVTIGYDFGGGNDADPAWAGYLNFLVKPIGGSVLGYSPLGGNLNAGSSIVLNTYAFGSGAGCSDSGIEPGANSNLGRTTTHELGHFFNLYHTFQGDSCDEDDGIADTPNIDGNNFGCPADGSIPGCDDQPALTMSYMDYTDDNCMYMFTQGQVDVIEDWLVILESQFKPNVTPVCVEIPEYIISNDTVTACNGLFYDSGGAAEGSTPGNYQNNENFTYTICPTTTDQSVQLSFTQFETQNNIDILTIYNADDATDPTTILGEWSGTDSPGTVAPTLTNTSGCLTVVFTSNGSINFPGWRANIQCIDPPAECQTIFSQLDSSLPAPNTENVIQVCVGEDITLTGSGEFSEPGGGVGAAYQWDLGDGRSISGQTATFSYDQPGFYIANLNIWDINTSVFPEGCKNDNTINQYINVSTTPSFGATEDTLNPICFGETSTVTALVTPTPFINDCTPPESNITFLPDGDGDFYTTCVTVDCFEDGQTLEDISQIFDLCLNIEHSYLGDLDIIISSPNGQQTSLHSYPSGGGTYLGGPIDNFTNDNDQGVGFDYCFSMAAPTLLVDGPTVTAGDPASASIAAGDYLPVESFAQLVGSPLNGDWCITIIDNLLIDNGYIFSWDLNFDYSNVTTQGSFTPEIVSGAWAGDEPTIDVVNGDTITISPDGEGEYCYTYSVLDDFGCEYSDEICVNVLPELVHAIPNDIYICDPVTSNPVFNLFQNKDIVLAPNPSPDEFVVTFHNSEQDAENDTSEIVNLNTYPGSDQEIIYIRFEYLDSDCFVIEPFQLNVYDVPEIFPVSDIYLCDGDVIDETASFDLDQQSLEILGTQSPSDFILTYHSSAEDADLGENNLSSPYNNTSNPQPIFVRIESLVGGGCYVASRDPIFNLVVDNQTSAEPAEDLVECDATSDNSLQATFNLDSQTSVILGTSDPLDFIITYHVSQADAENAVNPLSNSITGPSQTIYFRIVEIGASSCFGIGQFELRVDPVPTTTALDPLPACDDDGDGFAVFTLTEIDTAALNGQTGLAVSYHTTQLEAEAGTPSIGPSYTNTTANSEQVWVRLTNTAADCYSIMPLDLIVNPLPVPEPVSLAPECDDDFDGLQTFDLSSVASDVIGTQTDMVVSYHETDADAQAGVSPLGNSYLTNTPDVDTIHIRLENTLTGCYNVVPLDLIVEPLPTIASLPPYPLCDINSPGDLVEDFDLSTLDTDIINGQNATVSYHINEVNAQGNIDPLPVLYSSGTQIIYVALEDNLTGCRAVAQLELVVDPVPTTTALDPLPACDDDGDGFAVFTLTEIDTAALNGQT
ncbi:MAG: M43 family zinc metalloprotease, partial [Flavobacteriaceae bacterium]